MNNVHHHLCTMRIIVLKSHRSIAIITAITLRQISRSLSLSHSHARTHAVLQMFTICTSHDENHPKLRYLRWEFSKIIFTSEHVLVFEVYMKSLLASSSLVPPSVLECEFLCSFTHTHVSTMKSQPVSQPVRQSVSNPLSHSLWSGQKRNFTVINWRIKCSRAK